MPNLRSGAAITGLATLRRKAGLEYVLSGTFSNLPAIPSVFFFIIPSGRPCSSVLLFRHGTQGRKSVPAAFLRLFFTSPAGRLIIHYTEKKEKRKRQIYGEF